MRDAVKVLYNHWIEVHASTADELLAFENIHKLGGDDAIDGPLYTALVEYSDILQYEAFREGTLTALSLLHPLSEEGDK